MIVFNQAGNAITSITRFDNENTSFPKTNLLTKYTKQVAKSTTTSTVITFSFTGRDLVILNTNATSGVIYADKPSAATTTLTGSTTYTVDTDIEGTLVVPSPYIATVNSGITLRVTGAFGADESITFTENNLKKTDLYFDMGSTGTWTVSLTLSSSSTLEIGCVVGGSFEQYGVTTSHTKQETELSANLDFVSKASNYDALKAEIINDDEFVVIPARTLNGVWIAYGKIMLKDSNFTSKTYDGEIATSAKAEIR